MRNRLLTSLGLVAVLLLAGCNFFNASSTPSQDDLDELEAEIRALIGDAEASQPNQCRTIAFGAKPCGGPWTYLVYSTVSTDEQQLEELVSRYNALQAERNRELGLISDCALALRPDTALVGGRCVADTGN